MPLRRRLVLTMVGLLALGLFLSVGAIYGAIQDWRNDRTHDVLTAMSADLDRRLTATPPTGRRLAPGAPADDLGLLWRQAAETGDIPSFVQLRSPTGRVIDTLAVGRSPDLPDPLPAGADAVFQRAPSVGGGPYWLVRVARLSDGSGIVLVGMHSTDSDELVQRTTNVAIVSSVVVLLAMAVLSARAVRTALRPLTRIEVVAGAIGQGDLGRRVPYNSPKTEVGRLGAALNAMLGQIERAFRAREESEQRLRRFVADASHELRTPVATIRGYAELFRRGAADRPGDLAMAMRRIELEAARMGSLVDELLLLARLDQGRPLGNELVDLSELAADAVADARAVQPDRALELVATEPVLVVGDAERLRQVLGNLVGNVLRHVPAGVPATVRVSREDGHAVVEVADSGPGLAPQDAARVFERFYRSETARAQEDGGSGLGLSIVAAVASAHGGAADVESPPGGGTTFRVRLPAAPEEPE
ncbi:two-component system OmpR family sensor kinase [Actinoplanes campanulatus]|uniref:histidine kinase n=1 Tax=Actinoplanes campanulatus TaxID=113559 RepID=A0A7W5FC51_9ACTN|nr:HAMP domain-containing sensor histidine kinase [Actinoplanes campanulatus]MBB3092845.1 two-component system OmpR family sensor kinase [Actinoplanes campanulatus]GGM99413.1 two-component sensor histidine kinase [Actinoplanes campanulatus]GID34057.1 two-component sensor histidine kinase [Actinoplanes campanulatus]